MQKLIITRIPKAEKSTDVTKMRGIVLQSVMAKCYVCSLLEMAKEQEEAKDSAHKKGQVCLYGFKEEMKTEEVTNIIRWLGQAAEEWGQETICYFAGMDVQMAFDNTTVEDSDWAMKMEACTHG